MSIPPTLYLLPITLAARQKLLAPFRDAGATSPERAIPLALDTHARDPQFQSMLRHGIIVESSPGHYYLDEAAMARRNRAGRPVVIAVITILAAAGIIAALALALD
jgi:hypothetical protein